MQVNNNNSQMRGYPSLKKETNKIPYNNNMLKQNLQTSKSINLQWSDGAIYACATPAGNSFSIYKAEGYSKEAPYLYAKGVNVNGEPYEERIDPRKVDPRNASYVELQALNSYLIDSKVINSDAMGFFPRENADDLAKQDYMTILEEWRDMQKTNGNLAAYKDFSILCNAFLPFCK